MITGNTTPRTKLQGITGKRGEFKKFCGLKNTLVGMHGGGGRASRIHNVIQMLYK